MSDRQLALETIQGMPEHISLNDIIDEMALLASVQRGREQIRRGEGIPHEAVAQRLETWITESSGRRKP
jgi:predicted transcriptional regulator